MKRSQEFTVFMGSDLDISIFDGRSGIAKRLEFMNDKIANYVQDIKELIFQGFRKKLMRKGEDVGGKGELLIMNEILRGIKIQVKIVGNASFFKLEDILKGDQ